MRQHASSDKRRRWSMPMQIADCRLQAPGSKLQASGFTLQLAACSLSPGLPFTPSPLHRVILPSCHLPLMMVLGSRFFVSFEPSNSGLGERKDGVVIDRGEIGSVDIDPLAADIEKIIAFTGAFPHDRLIDGNIQVIQMTWVPFAAGHPLLEALEQHRSLGHTANLER